MVMQKVRVLRKQVVPSKKGKGSYNRKKEKNIAKQI